MPVPPTASSIPPATSTAASVEPDRCPRPRRPSSPTRRPTAARRRRARQQRSRSGVRAEGVSRVVPSDHDATRSAGGVFSKRSGRTESGPFLRSAHRSRRVVPTAGQRRYPRTKAPYGHGCDQRASASAWVGVNRLMHEVPSARSPHARGPHPYPARDNSSGQQEECDCDDARGDRGPGPDSLCDWPRALLPICRSGCAIVDEGPTGRAVT